MTTPALERLATLVQKRRTELRLGIEPAAKLGGISKDTWKRVEEGKKVWDRSYAGIDSALQWAVGSCLRVLRGDDPVTSEPAHDGVKVADVPKTDLERLVGNAVQHAAIATKGSLTGDEILELNRRVIEELRKEGVL
ncbi:hypothetical protein ACH4F6_31760 [Streptomyces sp. NPDC017936]|uniref:hypothetical protein n=1 Tax=Streptomyces sp. NPDC017936 TaxID=3365016 RepID=UPI0037A7FB02